MPQIQFPDNAADPREGLMANYASDFLEADVRLTRLVYDLPFTVREFEAARMRIALINGCRGCMAFRKGRDGSLPRESLPGEDFYEAIGDWRNSSLFSPRERLAIEFAERFAIDHRSLDGDTRFWTAMHANFTDSEILHLTLAVGHFIAFGRMLHVLELDNVCPMPVAAQSRAA